MFHRSDKNTKHAKQRRFHVRRIKVCNPEMLLIAPLSLSSVPLQAALVHYCIIRKHILWEVYVCVCVKIDNGCNLSRSEA